MAITQVNHVWSGDTWSDSQTAPRAYQSRYRVISDDENEGAFDVRSANGIPALGDAYPDDSESYCVNRSATRQDNTRLVWEVTVEYEYSENSPVDSPLDEPAQYRWTAGQYTKPCVIDKDGNAVVNSAGDYFDPPPETEDVRWSVNIQKNVASVPVSIISYAGAVCSSGFTVDDVTVSGEGLAKVVGLDISEQKVKNDIPYRTITTVIEFRQEGFDLELLDQGYRYKDGAVLKDILVEDEDGEKQRPSAPVLLDGNGEQLDDPSTTTAVFQTFKVDRRLDFSQLPGVV